MTNTAVRIAVTPWKGREKKTLGLMEGIGNVLILGWFGVSITIETNYTNKRAMQ